MTALSSSLCDCDATVERHARNSSVLFFCFHDRQGVPDVGFETPLNDFTFFDLLDIVLLLSTGYHSAVE